MCVSQLIQILLINAINENLYGFPCGEKCLLYFFVSLLFYSHKIVSVASSLTFNSNAMLYVSWKCNVLLFMSQKVRPNGSSETDCEKYKLFSVIQKNTPDQYSN